MKQNRKRSISKTYHTLHKIPSVSSLSCTTDEPTRNYWEGTIDPIINAIDETRITSSWCGDLMNISYQGKIAYKSPKGIQIRSTTCQIHPHVTQKRTHDGKKKDVERNEMDPHLGKDTAKEKPSGKHFSNFQS